jgi:HPt (histidine-containing phosphotransfer) domain-containing protein
MLAIYYKDGLAKTNELKECLDASDLHLYTVHVHGLKTASANIGAEALSEAAKALELAGENGDVEFIKANNSKFLENMESLLSEITNVLSAQEKNLNAGKTSTDAELLRRYLVKLKTALDILEES